MGELFSGFEQDFLKAIKLAANKLEVLQNLSLKKDQSHTVTTENDFKATRGILTECENNIKLMETQLTGLPLSAKSELLKKVRQYKREYENIRRTVNREQHEAQQRHKREALLSTYSDDSTLPDSQQIKDGNRTLEATQSLRYGRAIALETLEISDGIHQTLRGQSDQLLRNNSRLDTIQSEIRKGEVLIKKMFLRIRRNKFVFFSILAVLFLIVIIAMAVHFSRK